MTLPRRDLRDLGPASRTVVISQSNYIPWKGYFDNLALADVFVVFDDVQYTRRDWRNRNKIKLPTGVSWLTIPVKTKGRYYQPINDVKIADLSWAEKHWKTIQHAYGKAACFDDWAPELESVYASCASERYLTSINRRLIHKCCECLGIEVELRDSADLGASGDKSERLLSICLELGATHYLSGPAAKSYLDEDLFRSHDIEVLWSEYTCRPYRQLYGPFIPEVSVIDLILNEGHNATQFMTTRQNQ